MTEIPTPRKELFALPRSALIVQTGNAYTEACVFFWNQLRALDMTTRESVFPSAAVCDKIPPDLAKWHADYLKHCAQRSQVCDEALYGYRASITELLTKDTALSEIKDPKVMTDKMLARLLKGNNPSGVADAAERLMQVDPSFVEAARASVMSRLHDAQGAAGKPDDPRWKKFDESLDRASRANGDPGAYLESKLYGENIRYSDPEHLKQTAFEIGRQYPERGVGPYHEAWAEHASGNPARTLELLQEALRREPSNSRFRETYEAQKKGEAEPFRVSLSFQIAP